MYLRFSGNFQCYMGQDCRKHPTYLCNIRMFRPQNALETENYAKLLKRLLCRCHTRPVFCALLHFCKMYERKKLFLMAITQILI